MIEAQGLSDQLHEVHQGLLALGSIIENRTSQSESVQDLLRSEMNNLWQNQKDLEEKLDCVICVMQHDLEALRSSSAANAKSVGELLQVVQELRQPVYEIIALRSRVAGLVLGLGVLGSVAMWLAEPIYRWIIDQHFAK